MTRINQKTTKPRTGLLVYATVISLFCLVLTDVVYAAASDPGNYIAPFYVVDIASGGSNSIDEVMFKMVESAGASVTTDVSYAMFTASDHTGTIIKRGGGTLTLNKDLSKFTGPVHVEDGVAIGMCSNCFGRTIHGNGNVNQRTYVHSGATLVMDAVGNQPASPEANAVWYEGNGYPGLGGAFVARNGETAGGTSRWQMGCNSRVLSSARVYLDVPSGGTVAISYGGNTGQPASNFTAIWQDLFIHGRDVGSVFRLAEANITDIQNLVISNMTLDVAGKTCALVPCRDNGRSTVRFTGGSRWLLQTTDNQNNVQNKQTETLYIDDLEYIRFIGGTRDDYNYGVNPWGVTDGTTNNWWCGPVVLNDHIRMFNNYSEKNTSSSKRNFGITFSERVSGPMGFRPYVTSSGAAWGDGLRLNLLYPTNTFEGGIVLDGGSLGVWAEKAVPSQEGAGLVSITNGYVYFGRKGRAPSTAKWVDFTMPVTEFVGVGAVTNGTGVWRGLVKKGEGVLDYNSQLGGAYLDLQGGIVKFNAQYRGEYTGGNAPYAPDGYVAALPTFTKLKGSTGMLDLAGVAESPVNYTVVDMEGTPSVTNGNLTVTGLWTLDAATLGESVAQFSGTLAFGTGSRVIVSGDIESVPRQVGGFLVAKANNVENLPRTNYKGWGLFENGGEIRLCRTGFSIFVR